MHRWAQKMWVMNEKKLELDKQGQLLCVRGQYQDAVNSAINNLMEY